MSSTGEIERLAWVWLRCTKCKAEPRKACRKTRGDLAGEEYPNGYIHAARKQPFETVYKMGREDERKG